jgi:hypothetical protein
MKNLIIALGLIAAITIGSCSKKLVVVDTGTVKYINTSGAGNRYEMFLDGTSLGLINANSFFEKGNVTAGAHVVKATQIDGVIITPITVTKNVSITKAATLEFSFP